MSVSEFKKSLAKLGHGPGARWRKADFHIHAPGSSDYEYRGADAAEAMADAINREGLEFAVILKHQELPTRDELAKLQALCPATLLIPGAELNVIVDALFKKIGKDYFFHAILAVDPSDGRDYSYLLTRAKEEFSYRAGDYPAGFRSSVIELGNFFRDAGALFIPAHLHQGKSAETSRSVDDIYEDEAFLGFIHDASFSALEVRKQSTAKFFRGGFKTPAGLAVPRISCVSSSDAHSHVHIGERSRFTWVRTEELTFGELSAALSFPHRTRLEDPRPTHARVLGMHVTGSFIGDCWISLNEGINALIGSKGSGKTSLLECLRFVLATPVPPERLESVRAHMQHILGSAGSVECLVKYSSGEEVIVTRRADAPDRLLMLDEFGQSRTVLATEGSGLPVSILGWHEIEAVAEHAKSRIALLDRVSPRNEVRAFKVEIEAAVDRARDHMPVLQRALKKLQSELRRMWELRKKRDALLRLEKDELSAIQQDYEWFLAAVERLEALDDRIRERASTLPGALKSGLEFVMSAPRAGGSGESVLGAVSEIVQLLAAGAVQEQGAVQEMSASLDTTRQAVAAAKQRIEGEFQAFRESVYTPKVNALPAEEREILTRQIQVLEETKELPRIEATVETALSDLRGLAGELRAICEFVCVSRKSIVETRERLVAEVNDDVATVRLEFQKSGSRDAINGFHGRYGASAGELVGLLGQYPGDEHFQRLEALFARIQKFDPSAGEWIFTDLLYDVRAVDLLDLLDEDDVSIALQVGKAGFVPLQKLSAGQRCVAVFPLLLRDTRGPLVIDQPEDNLDNRYIADVIAPDLLSRKHGQQFILTSHNANLVVLTDADLVCHIESDGSRGEVRDAGFLACAESSVKQAVLGVLDGGESALTARRRKYGI